MTTNIIYSTSTQEFLGADINLSGQSPYSTTITTYNLPVTLTPPNNTMNGLVRKICNESVGDIQIDSQINLQDAPTNTLTMAKNTFIELMFLRNDNIPVQLWRRVDSSPTGITLS